MGGAAGESVTFYVKSASPLLVTKTKEQRSCLRCSPACTLPRYLPFVQLSWRAGSELGKQHSCRPG